MATAETCVALMCTAFGSSKYARKSTTPASLLKTVNTSSITCILVRKTHFHSQTIFCFAGGSLLPFKDVEIGVYQVCHKEHAATVFQGSQKTNPNPHDPGLQGDGSKCIRLATRSECARHWHCSASHSPTNKLTLVTAIIYPDSKSPYLDSK